MGQSYQPQRPSSLLRRSASSRRSISAAAADSSSSLRWYSRRQWRQTDASTSPCFLQKWRPQIMHWAAGVLKQIVIGLSQRKGISVPDSLFYRPSLYPKAARQLGRLHSPRRESITRGEYSATASVLRRIKV